MTNDTHENCLTLAYPQRFLISTGLLALSMLCSTAVFGQYESPSQAIKPSEKNVLEPHPYLSDRLGLRMHFPVGTVLIPDTSSGQFGLTVSDNPRQPTWTMRIQLAGHDQGIADPASGIDKFIKGFRDVGIELNILSHESRTFGSTTGQLCYTEGTNKTDQLFITGWLVIPRSDSEHLVFTIHTVPDHFSNVKKILAASFDTIAIRSNEEIDAERQARISAGQSVIDSATPAKLKSLIGVNQWFRIYTLDKSSGDTVERGYSMIDVREARRGELNPNRNERDYDDAERTPGFMVRVRGRVLLDVERQAVYDSEALCWMAWDQSEESWSIRGTHRQGDVEQSEAETGIRTGYAPGSLPPRLTVIKSNNATNTREPYEWTVPDTYLSQPLGWLIAHLLPTDVSEKREFGYYFYNFASGTPQISFRLDTWEPITDGNEQYKLTTRLTSDSPPVVSVYDSNASLIRRQHADGAVTEPITLDALHKLWKRKGLPVQTAGQ